MKLYSYVVARDYGFAPNPFHGTCTLATCKPSIRRHASAGDWIIGTGSANYNLTGHLVFAMKVTEAVSFDEYWADSRFEIKKPNLAGSLKQAFGDNIYRREGDDDWAQLDSHHSLGDGSPNPTNIAHDTQANRVLLSHHYAYFGSKAPELPQALRAHGTEDVCAARGYKVNFSEALVQQFIVWFEQLGVSGQKGKPSEWLNRGALKRGN